MKPGDLAYVKSTSTGDNPWVVELYRTRDPVLILKVQKPDLPYGHFWATLLHEGTQKHLRKGQLQVIET